jgi:hypothetical protein
MNWSFRFWVCWATHLCHIFISYGGIWFCYKGHIWKGGCNCETTMLRNCHSTFYIVTRWVPYSRFDGCIGSCLPTILVATRTWKKVQCSFGNHQGNLLSTKKVKPNQVWVPTLFSTSTIDFRRFLFVFNMSNMLSWQCKNLLMWTY